MRTWRSADQRRVYYIGSPPLALALSLFVLLSLLSRAAARPGALSRFTHFRGLVGVPAEGYPSTRPKLLLANAEAAARPSHPKSVVPRSELFTDPKPPPPADLDTMKNPRTKIMIVGDSMTQGHEGDWTWRYRIWQWAREQNARVTYVGPYLGTADHQDSYDLDLILNDSGSSATSPTTASDARASNPPVGERGYARGVSDDFVDSYHFAAWGRAIHQDKLLIQRVVKKYQPDLVLVMLGFNDMGWGASDAHGTLDSMDTFVQEARAAKPDLKFALANVVQRLFMDGRDDLPRNTTLYNDLLKTAILEWSTRESQIELVMMRENYACDLDKCPAGYDGLHPNELGEYQIAQAFTRTLIDKFGIGQTELQIPESMPERPTPLPHGLRALSCDVGINITWAHVYGAFGYDVQARRKDTEEWEFYRIPINSHTTWTSDGCVWEYRIRTENLMGRVSAWTEILSVVSHDNRIYTMTWPRPKSNPSTPSNSTSNGNSTSNTENDVDAPGWGGPPGWRPPNLCDAVPMDAPWVPKSPIPHGLTTTGSTNLDNARGHDG